MTSKKTSHIPSTVPSDYLYVSLLVFMSVHLYRLPSITTITLSLYISQAKNSVTRQAFIHYRLQLICQVWFHIFMIVTSQPMFQVCNREVDQVMVLLIFQSSLLSSTLVHPSHIIHLILLVPSSVPFY